MKSSLSPDRVNELPNVYHRPQVGSGVQVEFERKIKDFDTHEGYGINGRTMHFENPAVNSLDAFVRESLDNYAITRKFVIALNCARKRGYSKLFLARLGANYADMLVKNNICHLCRKPIKVTNASIVSIPKEALGDDDRIAELRKDSLHKPRKTSVSYPSSVDGKRIKVEFRAIHKKPSVGAITETYADIVPHYEFRKVKRGKFAFVFVSAINGRKVELTVDRFGKSVKYFLNGSEIKHTPPSTFRIFTEPCKCKAECLDCEKTYSIHATHRCKESQ